MACSPAREAVLSYTARDCPLEAPSVPLAYQLMKSTGHSTMALAEVVTPYLDNPENQSWRASLQAYRSRMQAALDGVAATDMPPNGNPPPARSCSIISTSWMRA